MSKKLNNLDYQAYKAEKQINEGLRILREGYVFHEDEAPAQEPVAQEPENPVDNSVDFIDKGEFSSADADVTAIRKLVFKAMEQCCDDVTSTKYNVMKKIWNLLDSIAKPADEGTAGNKE